MCKTLYKNTDSSSTSLYEDYHEGLLNKEEYLELKESYQEQMAELTESLDKMVTQRDGLTTAFTADTSQIGCIPQLYGISCPQPQDAGIYGKKNLHLSQKPDSYYFPVPG